MAHERIKPLACPFLLTAFLVPVNNFFSRRVLHVCCKCTNFVA